MYQMHVSDFSSSQKNIDCLTGLLNIKYITGRDVPWYWHVIVSADNGFKKKYLHGPEMNTSLTADEMML